MDLERLSKLSVSSDGKIIMLVMDGLGGLPMSAGGPTELEAARTPNLDDLAARSVCGLHDPVGTGITPGSGPGHLALFGYDPLRFEFGRGVLEALGIGFDLQSNDVAARGNFATMNSAGQITDRRAGRIETAKSVELVGILRNIKMPGVQIFVEPVAEHRFALIFRGEGLSDLLTETDPQKEGLPPRKVEALDPSARPTADLANRFIAEATRVLAGHEPANTVLLRGFAKHPRIPTLIQLYGLRAAAVATYPMYRGLGKLVGMDALASGPTFRDEIAVVAENWGKYDFFFVHLKKTDSSGEDGDFERKVHVIEEYDLDVPALLDLNPDVLIVTGDHSTPSLLRGHSWHPVPIVLFSKYARPDEVTEFSERGCARGSLGRFPGKEIMALALANALRLTKFGA